MRIPSLTALTLCLALSACGGSPSQSTPPPLPIPVPMPAPSPIGEAIGTPVQSVIGAAGGHLQTPDGSVSIDIPAGALSSDQTVGIQEIRTTSPAHFGRSFRLTPEGTTFAVPVTVRFHYTPEELLSTDLDTMRVAFQTPEGYWTPAPSQQVDEDAGSVTVQTTHFSSWGSIPGSQLSPDLATVKVGQTIPLELVICDDLAPGETNPLGFPVLVCDKSYAVARLAKNWAVNSVVGGNAAAGTVTSAAPGEAVYTAPSKKPAQNPVAVSVQYTTLEGQQQVTLLSHITVEEPTRQWRGTVTYSEAFGQSWKRAAPWDGGGSITFKQQHTYTVTGSGINDEGGPVELTFNQAGTGTYSHQEHSEWKHYAPCQAGGPEMLREHHISGVDASANGSMTKPTTGSLLLKDGQYHLSVSTAYGEITGQHDEIHWDKYFCTGAVLDSPIHRPEKRTLSAPLERPMEGQISTDGHVRGSYDQTLQDTVIHVAWDLAPVN
jgi:hypothetical protein